MKGCADRMHENSVIFIDTFHLSRPCNNLSELVPRSPKGLSRLSVGTFWLPGLSIASPHQQQTWPRPGKRSWKGESRNLKQLWQRQTLAAVAMWCNAKRSLRSGHYNNLLFQFLLYVINQAKWLWLYVPLFLLSSTSCKDTYLGVGNWGQRKAPWSCQKAFPWARSKPNESVCGRKDIDL